MASYTLPRETFDLLLEALGEKQKAEAFAKAIESAICAIDEKAKEAIIDKKEHIKIELKEELKNELATKGDLELTKGDIRYEIDMLRQEMQTIKAGLEGKIDTETARLEGRIARLDQKFNFMIILMIIALTLMNPVVAEIIKKALKL